VIEPANHYLLNPVLTKIKPENPEEEPKGKSRLARARVEQAFCRRWAVFLSVSFGAGADRVKKTKIFIRIE
jgi:hypothetical protein